MKQIDYELRPTHKATLAMSSLGEWAGEPVALDYGTLVMCRGGEATLHVNFSVFTLRENSVLLLFPNDVVMMPSASADFVVEQLRYDAALLREASLQMEHTVYSQLRANRGHGDSPVVTAVVDAMFAMLRAYFVQRECKCLDQLVILQLKAFFVGFYDYSSRQTDEQQFDDKATRRQRELFNVFMQLLEERCQESRDVGYYASLMHITPKYLSTIVGRITSHRVKTVIDHYVVLQLKLALKNSTCSVKEIAWQYHFSDLSFFCRYFKQHTGLTPQDFRRRNVLKR